MNGRRGTEDGTVVQPESVQKPHPRLFCPFLDRRHRSPTGWCLQFQYVVTGIVVHGAFGTWWKRGGGVEAGT